MGTFKTRDELNESINSRVRAKIAKQLKSDGFEVETDYRFNGGEFIAKNIQTAKAMLKSVEGKFKARMYPERNPKSGEVPVMITESKTGITWYPPKKELNSREKIQIVLDFFKNNKVDIGRGTDVNSNWGNTVIITTGTGRDGATNKGIEKLFKKKNIKFIGQNDLGEGKFKVDASNIKDPKHNPWTKTNEDATPSNVNGMGNTSMPSVGGDAQGSGDKIHDLAAGATGNEVDESYKGEFKKTDSTYRYDHLTDDIEKPSPGSLKRARAALGDDYKKLKSKGKRVFMKDDETVPYLVLKESKLIVAESLEEFMNEDWKSDAAEMDKRIKVYTGEMTKILKGNKLGNLKNEDIKIVYDSIVEFKTKVDGLQLDWGIYIEDYNGKNEVRVEVSSPNKRGVYTKKATGRNATPAKIWELIQNIYNGKYKR